MEDIELQNRVLLYLASGDYWPHYEELPYEKVILVDKTFHKEAPPNSKVELIKCDALESIDVLLKRNIEIDCVVFVNDGMSEGAGTYPMLSEFVIGYLRPILADTIMVVVKLSSEYHVEHMMKMNWGYKKIKNPKIEKEKFLHPQKFTKDSCTNSRKNGTFILKKLQNLVTHERFDKIKITLVHDSIWKYRKELGVIGLSFTIKEIYSGSFREKQYKFFYNKPKTKAIRDKSIDQIIEEFGNKKIIGLTPWLEGDYTQVIEYIKNHNGDKELDLRFYHLNEDDYKQLYRIMPDYFIRSNPSFFRNFTSSQRESFKEVLLAGYGELIEQLCKDILRVKEYEDFYFEDIKLDSGELVVTTQNAKKSTTRVIEDSINNYQLN